MARKDSGMVGARLSGSSVSASCASYNTVCVRLVGSVPTVPQYSEVQISESSCGSVGSSSVYKTIIIFALYYCKSNRCEMVVRQNAAMMIRVPTMAMMHVITALIFIYSVTMRAYAGCGLRCRRTHARDSMIARYTARASVTSA